MCAPSSVPSAATSGTCATFAWSGLRSDDSAKDTNESDGCAASPTARRSRGDVPGSGGGLGPCATGSVQQALFIAASSAHAKSKADNKEVGLSLLSTFFPATLETALSISTCPGTVSCGVGCTLVKECCELTSFPPFKRVDVLERSELGGLPDSSILAVLIRLTRSNSGLSLGASDTSTPSSSGAGASSSLSSSPPRSSSSQEMSCI
mmetsp:Transcript_50624/g.134812  ORF Transcript_50624/g.134812 Transcript_50624/m.134812 type:complete len:207 (-) Transcript_50624:666-1286(-)